MATEPVARLTGTILAEEVDRLEAAFRDPTWMARVEAIEATEGLIEDDCRGDSLSLGRLLELLAMAAADSRWEVRRAAARALGRTADPRAAAMLERLATDDNRYVQRAAAHAKRRNETTGPGGDDPTTNRLIAFVRKMKPGKLTRKDLLQLARFSGELHYQDLAAETSHEVNTIVTGLNGYLAALEDRLRETAKADPVLAELSAKLRGRAKQLTRLVDDLRAYTATPGLFGTVRLHKIVQDALEVARGRLGPSKLPPGLTTTVDVPADISVEAVEDRLVRAIANLIANGIEAIQSAGEVRVSAKARGGLAMISVSDTGCGMTPDGVRDAPLRYTTTKREKGGTGLGLPIAIRILEKEHRGRVKIESEPGKGTTVRIEIPLRQERVSHGAA